MAADVLLFGGNGQLGWELRRSLAPFGRLAVPDRAQCDIADVDATVRVIREVSPRIIVNAAAFTAVDRAESEEATARRINVAAPAVMAAEARRLGIPLVHYSTDYVFDGTKAAPYVEEDAPNPLGVYGQTKHAGEQAIAASGAEALVFRTSWVFGVHGGNFVRTILRLARERDSLRVVDDQVGSPTPAALIADVTALALAQLRRTELPSGMQLYHLAAANPLSWHRFATTIVERALLLGLGGIKLRPEAIVPITTAEFPLPAARPANSRLDCRRLEHTYGITLPDWRPYLERMLAKAEIDA